MKSQLFFWGAECSSVVTGVFEEGTENVTNIYYFDLLFYLYILFIIYIIIYCYLYIRSILITNL